MFLWIGTFHPDLFEFLRLTADSAHLSPSNWIKSDRTAKPQPGKRKRKKLINERGCWLKCVLSCWQLSTSAFMSSDQTFSCSSSITEDICSVRLIQEKNSFYFSKAQIKKYFWRKCDFFCEWSFLRLENDFILFHVGSLKLENCRVIND